MSLDQLSYCHSARTSNIDKWNFLYRSYIGGEEYRKGRYLHPYWGENNAPFDAYGRRLKATPLDNHVRTTVDIYRSYIWKHQPIREFNTLRNNPFLEDFLYDCDLNGQTIDSWMKDLTAWAMVLGDMWVLVDKPAVDVESAIDEVEMRIRPYVTTYTPQNVLDWGYRKLPNGKKCLSYIKTLEWSNSTKAGIRTWTEETITDYVVNVNEITGDYDSIVSAVEQPNSLGRVPFIRVQPLPLPNKDSGASLLEDVADTQRSIYNKLSELEQNIRISNHPMLVKGPETIAEAGAGGVITVPNGSDDIDPKILQPTGASIDGILKSIERDVEAINSMTHLTAVREQKSSMSGVALQTERQLLNAKLSDLADTIQEVEYKIWDLWCDWQDVDNTVSINYIKMYDLRDPKTEMELLEKAIATVNDPAFTEWARNQILELVIKDSEELDTVRNRVGPLAAPEAGNTDTGEVV